MTLDTPNDKFLCLCPVYGTPPHLLEESIKCFLDQVHPDKLMVIFDDLGNIEPKIELPDGVILISSKKRMPTLISKYNMMLEERADCTAVSLWDVDDIYLPQHLAEHNTVLKQYQVSYPDQVWSTYTGSPQKEQTGGRFWASLAIRMKLLLEIGFIPTGRADFDQQSLRHFCYGTPPHKRYGSGFPTYVFRWADTDSTHGQGGMKSPDDLTWYTEYKPHYTYPITELIPQYRNSTLWQMSQLLRHQLVS